MRYLLICMLMLALTTEAQAQETSDGLGDIESSAPQTGVGSFAAEKDNWRRENENKTVILQTIIDSVGKAGISNITDAEQVFCYEVSTKPLDYNGYTLDNMALTGFCGVVSKELKDMIVKQFLATGENIALEVSEQCVIKPKLMLRFVKGVDFTDILLSSPCYSFSVFYGGKVKSYNFKPGADIIDTMVEAFKTNRMDFTSPALLNQLLPVGVVQNEEQKKTVQEKSGPVRGWETGSAQPQEKKSGGWNALQ